MEQVVTVNLFIEELRKTEKLKDAKYTYWDERLSSKVYSLFGLRNLASYIKHKC